MPRSLLMSILVFCALLAIPPLSAQEKPFGGQLGIDVSGMDRSARPQDDFFRFVNGAWADRTEIPADKSRYGSFNILSDESEEALKEIVEQAAMQKDAPPGSEVQKVGDLYSSFMNEGRIESLGIKPLQSHLDYVAKLNSTADVAAALFQLSRIGIGTVLLLSSVQQDPKH